MLYRSVRLEFRQPSPPHFGCPDPACRPCSLARLSLEDGAAGSLSLAQYDHMERAAAAAGLTHDQLLNQVIADWGQVPAMLRGCQAAAVIFHLEALAHDPNCD